ncbi:hypothetical protein JK364_23430 [Streptomyces sp. 110]|uniref:Uncharacterized protein n=1 Tax=Streptomyces endocoffeicus TaxID=2898945 RepID=A0ABS1PSB0_9ACTN|nr:hypothetical protein [Streptomyces endocoffeicus]MBL1115325.1 hypothetical protein [Streptomyces endocoffeicus]
MATDKPNRSPKKGTTKDQSSTSVSQGMPRQGRGTKSLGPEEDIEKPPEGKASVPKQLPAPGADSSGPSGAANTAPKMPDAADTAETAGKAAGAANAGCRA